MPPWGADPDRRQVRERHEPEPGARSTRSPRGWTPAPPKATSAELPKAPAVRRGLVDRQPDLVFKMVKPFNVPADGTVPYLYVTIPTNLKEDIWIRGVELRPTRSPRRAPHHQRPGRRRRQAGRSASRRSRKDPGRKEIGGVGGLVPGRLYGVFEEGVARKIPAGADIVLQMHYTTIGQAVDRPDRDRRRSSPRSRRRGCASRAAARCRTSPFVIPPGHPNYEVTAKKVIDKDTYLTQLYPHMHVRGKDVQYKIIYPGRPRRSRAERAEVRLQLADQLPAGRAEVHAEGLDADGHRATTTTRRATASTRIRQRQSAGAIRRGKRC